MALAQQLMLNIRILRIKIASEVAFSTWLHDSYYLRLSGQLLTDILKSILYNGKEHISVSTHPVFVTADSGCDSIKKTHTSNLYHNL